MSCERYRDALADAAVGGPEPGGLKAHLASCEACRAELSRLRRVLDEAEAELAVLATAEPSPDLPARIRQAVANTPAAAAWRFGWLWPATAVAAALLVALAIPRAAPPPVIPRVVPSPAPEGSASLVIPRAAALPSPEGSATRPEVLVPAGERDALLRLVALVHRERLTLAGLDPGGQSGDLTGPHPLDIPPLEIVPLDPAEFPGT